MVKVTLGATVPVAQYANVQPTVETEAATFEEAYAQANGQIRTIWNDFCERGKELPAADKTAAPVAAKLLTKLTSTITPGTAMFDEEAHIYYDDSGKQLISGTKFAEKYKYEFNPAFILPKMVNKYGVPAETIQATWDLRKEAAIHFGNSVHRALELYGKYEEAGKKMEKSMLCDLPLLNAIVATYFDGKDNETALYEEFVTDGIHCGTIDRFQITGDKHCIIRDFKTSPDLNKQGSPKMLKAPFTDLPNTPGGGYALQLNYYADIVEKAGWTVDRIIVDHWNGEWTEVAVRRINVIAKTAEEWVTA